MLPHPRRRAIIELHIRQPRGFPVEALCIGPLAIHRSLTFVQGEWHISELSWSISHITSGRALFARGIPSVFLARRIVRLLLTCGDWTQQQPDRDSELRSRASELIRTRVFTMIDRYNTRRRVQFARRSQARHRRPRHDEVKLYQEAARIWPTAAMSIMAYWDPRLMRQLDAMRRARCNPERRGCCGA